MKKIFSIFAAVLFAGSMMADNYVLVSDASTLADGDQIIITNVVPDRAISTTQNSNNRGVAEVTPSEGVIVPGDDVQIITLVAADANFMLQVGENAYLYAASNSSNHLKTSTAATAGDNGKFAITIDAEGVAAVTAQGTNSRNSLRYNTSGMFSCYGSSSSVEAGLKIFKKQGGDVPPVEDDCNWDEIAFLGNGSGNAAYTDRFKICAGDPAPTDIVNIQAPDWAGEPGIYVAFPSAAFGAISLDEDQYAIQGAGMLLYVSAFLYDAETEVTVVCQEVTYTLTVKNVNPETAPVVIPQYEVAEAIAAGLADNTEIEVRGIITRMEMKGKNFAKYGSVNIYVADANGAEGEFVFFNCYSLAADTFKTTVPAYDAASASFSNITEVADANGYTIHVGDTVIAHGTYKLYNNTTHELNTGCYIVYAKVPGAPYPTDIDNTAAEQKAIKLIENGQLFIIKNGVRYDAQGTVVR